MIAFLIEFSRFNRLFYSSVYLVHWQVISQLLFRGLLILHSSFQFPFFTQAEIQIVRARLLMGHPIMNRFYLAKFDRWPLDTSSMRLDYHFEYGILSTYAARHNRKAVSEFVVPSDI